MDEAGFVSAYGGGKTFAQLVGDIVGAFNTIFPVLLALAVVLLFVGIIKYIRHQGEREKGTIIMWSLIAIFVMLSMWGILRIMCHSLTGTGSCKAAGSYGTLIDNQPYDI
jgi:hypothetical protein